MPIRHGRAALPVGIDSILDIRGILRCRGEPDSENCRQHRDGCFRRRSNDLPLGDIYDTRKYRCFIVFPTRLDIGVIASAILPLAKVAQPIQSRSPWFVRLPRSPRERFSRSTAREFNLVARLRAQRALLAASEPRFSYIRILQRLRKRLGNCE